LVRTYELGTTHQDIISFQKPLSRPLGTLSPFPGRGEQCGKLYRSPVVMIVDEKYHELLDKDILKKITLS
jgi:hypothetical protein